MNFPLSEIITFSLGLITSSISNDSQAKTLCCKELLELKPKIQFFKKRNLNTLKKIKLIKKNLESLNINHTCLFIQDPNLQELIDISLSIILRSSSR